MSELLEHLRADHVNLGRILDLLERKIDDLARGDDSATETLSAIAAYCLDYPALTHHPAEQAIAERLRRLSPEVVHAIGDIGAEHLELAESARQFSDTVAALSAGGTVLSRQAVVDGMREFAARYRRHIDWEESELFPAAEQCLEAADWEALCQSLEQRVDPLTVDNVQTPYRVLRDALIG